MKYSLLSLTIIISHILCNEKNSTKESAAIIADYSTERADANQLNHLY
jgi:hypothetical protein